MIDTIKLLLLPKQIKCTWDIKKITTKLNVFDKFHRKGIKPIGYIGKGFAVFGNNNFIIIEGSLTKYFLDNNIENFDWKFVKVALRMLSQEIGLPIERGKVLRLDIAYNFQLNEPVINYFPELKHLWFFQRIDNRKTTLRFMRNDDNVNVLFYDKLNQAKKLIKDESLAILANTDSLIRYEVQIQHMPSKVFGFTNIRVFDLWRPFVQSLLLDYWFKLYQDIEKKAVLVFPKSMKGRKSIDKFVMRYFIENLGWVEIKSMFDLAQKNGSLTHDDKSKKIKMYRKIMSNNETFEFKNITKELNFKIESEYLNQQVKIKKLKNH